VILLCERMWVISKCRAPQGHVNKTEASRERGAHAFCERPLTRQKASSCRLNPSVLHVRTFSFPARRLPAHIRKQTPSTRSFPPPPHPELKFLGRPPPVPFLPGLNFCALSAASLGHRHAQPERRQLLRQTQYASFPLDRVRSTWQVDHWYGIYAAHKKGTCLGCSWVGYHSIHKAYNESETRQQRVNMQRNRSQERSTRKHERDMRQRRQSQERARNQQAPACPKGAIDNSAVSTSYILSMSQKVNLT